MSKKNIPYIEETYDVVVVGAGHAGCEAALMQTAITAACSEWKTLPSSFFFSFSYPTFILIYLSLSPC